MKNAGIEIKSGNTYRVERAGMAYLTPGEVYTVDVHKRTVDFRRVSGTSGTTVSAWEIQQGLVILTEVNS